MYLGRSYVSPSNNRHLAHSVTLLNAPFPSSPRSHSFAPLVGGLWFPFLNKVNLSSKSTTAMARVSMDQFIAAPVVLGGFFAFVGMLEGGGVEDVKEKVQSVSLRSGPKGFDGREGLIGGGFSWGFQSWLTTLKTNW